MNRNNRLVLLAALALVAAPAFADGLPEYLNAPPRVEAAPLPAPIIPAPAPAAAPVRRYFRPLDLAHPRFIAGGYLDPETVESSEGGTAVALFTHATEDGCRLPSFVCMDWTPIAAGVVTNGGKFKFAFGPIINLAPLLKSLALKGLNATTKDESFGNLKSTLGSVPIHGPDVTVSIGPAWVLAPLENWKGYFRIFMGGELRFGKK